MTRKAHVRSLTALLATVLVLVALPAFAQEGPETNPPAAGPPAAGAPAAPKIIKLDRLAAPPGSAILVRGSGFGKDPTKIRATLGGKDCLVTEATGEGLYLILSLDAKLGPTTLVVTVAGLDSNAIAFEVLDPNKLTDEFWKKRTEEIEENKRREQESALARMIRIEDLAIVAAPGGQAAIIVKGQTEDLPDGFKIALQINFDDQILANGSAFLKKGAFTHRFGPFSRRLFPGRYQVDARFILGFQPLRVRKRWIDTVGLDTARRFQALQNWQFFDIGDQDQAVELANSQRETYLDLLARCQVAFKGLQDNYASTVRSLFVEKKSLDEEGWKAWLRRQNFARDEKSVGAIERNRKYLRGLYLDPDKWESYVRDLIGELVVLGKELDVINAGWMLPRFPKAKHQLASMLSVLLDLARVRTRVLFQRNGLRVPQDLKTQFGLAPFDPSPRATVGRFLTLARRMRRDLAKPVTAPVDDGEGVRKAREEGAGAEKSAPSDDKSAPSDDKSGPESSAPEGS